MSDKFDITIYLKYFIFPIISLISITIIYFVLILPYLNIKNELDNNRDQKKAQIQKFEAKLTVLRAIRLNKNEVQKYRDALNNLVPSDESPAPLVGVLDATASKFNFSRVDENKNVADQALTNQGFIEVRFNGRTAGALSALNFISSLNRGKDKLINLRNIELYDDRDNRYYRVSFISRTVFNKNKPVASLETPAYDILNDENFKNFMKNYIN